jgi:hypothetical protein
MIIEAKSTFKNIGESSITSFLPLDFWTKPLIKGAPVFISLFFAYFCQSTTATSQRLTFSSSVRCRPHSLCIAALRKAVFADLKPHQRRRGQPFHHLIGQLGENPSATARALDRSGVDGGGQDRIEPLRDERGHWRAAV